MTFASHPQSLHNEITRLRQELKAAEDREARCKLVQNHSFESAVILDQEGYVLDANETLLRVTQIPRDLVTGYHISQFIAPQSLDLVQQKTQSECTASYEAYIQRQDGTTFPALVHATQSTMNRAPVQIITFQDITETKEKQLKTELALQELETIYSNSIVGIIMLDGQRVIQRANPQFASMFGYKNPTELEGQSISIIHCNPDSFQQFGDYYQTTLAHQGETDVQTQFKCKDGQIIWTQVSGKAIDSATPPDLSKGVIWIFRDISVRKAAQQELERALAELETFFNNSMVGILMMRDDRKIYRVNQRLADIMGYSSPDEIDGRSTADLHLSETHFIQFGEQYYSALAQHEISQIEYKFRRKDGSPVWLSISGRAIDQNTPADLNKGVVWIFEDISDRKEAERKLIELASIDPLTGVNNRRNFMDLGERELAIHQRQNRPMCVAMMDLDYFKHINDDYGHKIGDEALKLFSRVCTGALRTSDIIGRLGGEEFALILPDTDLEQGYIVAERIRIELQEATEIHESYLPPMTVSIGITTIYDADPLEVLLQRADTNLYRAKAQGRNQVAKDMRD